MVQRPDVLSDSGVKQEEYSMQHTLTFTKNKKKYVSKPFDFETMCIVNDAHNNGETKGPINICRGGVDYMFEGTEATQDIIDSLDAGERSRLCLEVWGFYAEALSSKKEKGREAAV